MRKGREDWVTRIPAAGEAVVSPVQGAQWSDLKQIRHVCQYPKSLRFWEQEGGRKGGKATVRSPRDLMGRAWEREGLERGRSRGKEEGGREGSEYKGHTGGREDGKM